MSTVNVEKLIKKSLQELQKISYENKIKTQNSKLIFPKYRDDKQQREKRISEQEARFLFVRELEKSKNTDLYYSVETPTKERYKDFSSENPKIGEGRSGNIDLTLYQKNENEFKRTHLIEFKNNNVKTCTKDFLKLLCDDNQCETNYYINIIKNSDKTTKERLENTLENLQEDKYQKAINYVFDKYKTTSKLKIFVCILNDIKITKNNIIEYQIIDNENQSIKRNNHKE